MDGTDIDVVFFDAAGTLFEVRGSVGQIYSTIAARHGVQADAGELERAFRRAFRAQSVPTIAAAPEDLERSERRWWLDVVKQVFAERMPDRSLRDYFDEVFEFFQRAEAWDLFPEARSVLSFLHSRGFRLGVISNFDSRLLTLLRNLQIESYFAEVTLSWRAGAAKPDRRIFDAALESMGVESRRAIHVGDSLNEDFEGARSAGMHAILVDRGSAYRGAVDDRCRAGDLSEVCALLGTRHENHRFPRD
jgi:putative hydrolase of the HAD superfamily